MYTNAPVETPTDVYIDIKSRYDQWSGPVDMQW